MADQWQIVINTSEYVFDITTRFTIRDRAEFTAAGELDYTESVILLQGVLVGQPPDVADSVAEQFKALRALVAKAAPVRVELKLNGVTEYDFQPSQSLGSPRIAELVELPGGATHSTHAKFEMNVYVKSPKVEGGTSIIEFEKEATAEYYNERLTRVTWRTRAKGTSLSAAKAKVLSTKPNIKPLMATYRQNVRMNEYEAVWVYDKEKGGGLLSVTESISIKKAGAPVTADPRVGKNAAVAFHRGRHRPGELVITVQMEASDEALIKRPGSHLTDSQFVKRDRTKEPSEEGTAIFDARAGKWRASFTEFYYYDFNEGQAPPTLIHTEMHDQPFPEKTVPIPPGGVSFK